MRSLSKFIKELWRWLEFKDPIGKRLLRGEVALRVAEGRGIDTEEGRHSVRFVGINAWRIEEDLGATEEV